MRPSLYVIAPLHAMSSGCVAVQQAPVNGTWSTLECQLTGADP